MGWYKVPRSSFDYAPALLDTVLVNRGVKEPKERKVTTATLVQFEKDARTMPLIGSFSEMMGASSSRLIKETLEDETLSKRTRDVLTGLVDMEVSHGFAAFYALMLASTLDANAKLLRKQGVLSTFNLQLHLAQAAYWLHFGPSGSRLFGDGLVPLLEMEEELSTKKHTTQLSQAMLKQF